MKATIGQKGFSLLAILVLAGTIGLVGLIGVIVWKNTQNKPATNSTDNASTSQNRADDSPSWLAQSYTSKAAQFSMKYPQSWQLKGIRAGQPVDQLVFQVAAESIKLNNFKGTLTISDTPPGDEKWPLYPNGAIIKTFKNGIGLWRDNQTQYLEKGEVQNNCPSLRIANEESFGFKLKSGKYISFVGSFCSVAGSKTSYSYGQQLTSDEFTYVSAMLQSINQ